MGLIGGDMISSYFSTFANPTIMQIQIFIFQFYITFLTYFSLFHKGTVLMQQLTVIFYSNDFRILEKLSWLD